MTTALIILSIGLALQTVRVWRLKRQRRTLIGMVDKTEAARVEAIAWGQSWFKAYHDKQDQILDADILEQ